MPQTQLMPTTRPLLFHISPYGGSRPAANKTDAIMPTTSTGVSLPATYNGWLPVSQRPRPTRYGPPSYRTQSQRLNTIAPEGLEQQNTTHPYRHDQRGLDSSEHGARAHAQQDGRPRAPLATVNQRLGPADETQHHEDLGLDLDGDIEVLYDAVDAEGHTAQRPSAIR